MQQVEFALFAMIAKLPYMYHAAVFTAFLRVLATP
jgi:hypothetical protein